MKVVCFRDAKRKSNESFRYSFIMSKKPLVGTRLPSNAFLMKCINGYAVVIE